MEFFQKATVVRLRSYHDKYLLANDDEESIFQDRRGCYANAKWNVELVDSNVIRLKSCYGKYLTTTKTPFLLGATGKKVLQTLPSKLNTPSLEWEPIREGMQVKLKTHNGHYLRANGGPPPWKNSVTHDLPHWTATTNWILWDIDIVELRPQDQINKIIRQRPTTPIARPDPFSNPVELSPSSSLSSDKGSRVKLISSLPGQLSAEI